MKTVLCIGGSDPSGGAGIQIDIPTIYAHGCLPLTAITAITSQNSEGFYDYFTPEPQTLRLQLEVLAKDYTIDAVKIGMLGNIQNVKVVTNFIKNSNIEIVVLDPVIKSSTGYNMLDTEGRSVLKEELLPACSVVTPNIDEAMYLSGLNIKDIDDMRIAASKISDMGIGSVIVKGGHLEGRPIDLIYSDDETSVLESDRIEKSVRGTGCMFSSSLACNIAQGLGLKESAKSAKSFVRDKIAKGKSVGSGSPQVTSF